jgi:hypothetical protein
LRERYRQLKEKLSEDQKKYKREVEQRAKIKYYKMEFKFNLQVK